MEFLGMLWLPIVASAALIFIVSSVIHMVVQIHKNDYSKLSSETEQLAAMREHGIGPGSYMFPCPSSMKDMGSPEMLEKYKLGPSGYLTVLPPGPPAIGKSLLQWFLYTLLVGVFVAYIADLALVAGAPYMRVFQFTGAAAFMSYGVAPLVESIWKSQAWCTSFKFVFDGLLYALSTAGCFAWLWPELV